MRLVLLADVHGNLPALEAVLAELERHEPDHVVVAGDLINGAPLSCEVVDLVREQGWRTVRGNHEFYYLHYGTSRADPSLHHVERFGQIQWLTTRMTRAQHNYLAMLPDDFTFLLPDAEPLRIAHGIPGNNQMGFTIEHSTAHIGERLQHIADPLLVTAHSHQQFDRQIRLNGREWRLINPGTVGLPINGNPAAQFAILENNGGQWRTTLHTAAYDRRPALEAFRTMELLEASIMNRLYYWTICLARDELTPCLRWCRENGFGLDEGFAAGFAAYVAATGRDEFVWAHDPTGPDRPA
jgi:predicted phosphodiesterase